MSASNKKSNLLKLEESSQHPQWRSHLQTHMFSLFHNINMDKLTQFDTLDLDFFKADPDFKEAHKEASKDNAGDKVHPFRNPDNTDFRTLCLEHAQETGEGHHDWLYVLFNDVRSSLSTRIQAKTNGVAIRSGTWWASCRRSSSQFTTSSSWTRTTSSST